MATTEQVEKLSRGRVLEAALAIALRDGAQTISMRRLAEELGVSTMAAYRHVAGRDGLDADLVGHIVAGGYRSIEKDANGWVKVPASLMRGHVVLDQAVTLALAVYHAFTPYDHGEAFLRGHLNYQWFYNLVAEDPGHEAAKWFVELGIALRDATGGASDALRRQVLWLIRSADDEVGLESALRWLIAGARNERNPT